MLGIKAAALRDLITLKNDFTKHLVYTLFIVLIASVVTYFLLKSFIGQRIDDLTNNFLKNQKTTMVVLPNPKEDLYTERGSPYDNRTVGTESANVIFHGPRTKKQVALTFDAEMTDGMKANLISGAVKSSYDKRIIDILDQTHTKATLFLTGMWIELYPKETEDLSKDPLFEFGSHSYTDSSYYGFCYGLQQLSSTIRIEEIGATRETS